MNKVIFIYWDQKFINAPNVVKKCLLTWKLNNPTWKIIELDKDNLNEYVNIEKEIPDIKKKDIKKCHYADIIRVLLLDKYGGCWCDATTFCNKSLDNWLNNQISTGFFAFEKPGKDRLLSNWFLYSEKNNYIIQKWKEKIINYWKNNNKINHYFRHHYLFNDLYKSDNKFKELWDLTPKISADGPHYIQNEGLVNKLSKNVENHIYNVKTPLYKLSYKYNEKKYNENCNLSYLLNTIKIKFIHIGKCGGTTITELTKLKQYHLNRKYKDNENYIIWIRNPIHRFVSAFYYVKDVINTDISNLNIKTVSLDNCLAPDRIIKKINTGYAYNIKYTNLVNSFETANELAESITSENLKKKELALELMNSKQEHIFKSIGWYLNNGDFIEKNHNKIIFVGTNENMSDDLEKVSNLLNIKINNKIKIRNNKNNNDKYLSPKAIQNILNFYKDTDYKALQKLVEFNFISNDIYKGYFYYDQ